MLVRALDEGTEARRAAIILPVFRAIAAPWVAAIGPTQGAEVRNAAATAARAAAAGNAAATATYVSNAANAAAAIAVDAAARAVKPAAYAWEAASADATALEEGQSPERVAALPLWPETPPNPVAKAWPELWEHLINANEGWEVWTEWYDDRLHGRPFNKALEEARVLIDPELWEQGPKAVNARIKRLIDHPPITGTLSATEGADVFSAGGIVGRGEQTLPPLRQSGSGAFDGNRGAQRLGPPYGGSDATSHVSQRIGNARRALTSALGSRQLKASLADFKHDAKTNRVELVPFAEDLPELRVPALLADHADKLDALAGGCTSLAADLKEDAPNVPKALARDLWRYAKQAGNGPELANPRLLRIYGAALTRATGDSETMLGLGTYLGGKLADIVDAHATLMADYLASIRDPMEAAADIPLAPEATLAAIADTLELIATRLPEAEWGDLPVPSNDLTDLLHEQAEELREIERQIDRTVDAKDRAVLERMRQQTAVSALSTVGRFTVFTASVAISIVAIAAAPIPSLGVAAAAAGIVQFVDWLFPETLKPHLRRVINWLLMRQSDIP